MLWKLKDVRYVHLLAWLLGRVRTQEMLASVCTLLPQVDFFQGLKQMGKCS